MGACDHFDELSKNGFCVLRRRLPAPLIEACRDGFWPVLLAHVARGEANRGPCRYFLPMPFERPCFAPEFFFDEGVLEIARREMGERIVADQWGCDAPVRGSEFQDVHVDYRRPLFAELPDLPVPAYMLVASFGLIDITQAHGPIEIAPGTHKMARDAAMAAVRAGEIAVESVPLGLGDVLIRHPWALHRGTPNRTDTPRPLLTIRYVREWYWDNSREVNAIPRAVWESLTAEQRKLMRFPVAERPRA